MRLDIRPATTSDAAAVAAIYNPYVADSTITVETESVTPGEMATRIGEAQSANLPWLVAIEGEAIVGYAYASKEQGRCAYRYAVESTVYLEAARHTRGIGRALYVALIDALRTR